MKKLILVLTIILLSVNSYGQTSNVAITVNSSNSTSVNVSMNTNFILEVFLSCSGCSNQQITIPIGNLTYTPSSNLPSGVTISYSGNTLTINVGCFISQTIPINLKFNSNCQIETQSLVANLSGCKSVTSNTINVVGENSLPTLTIYENYPSSVCRGMEKARYTISLHNPANGSTITNSTLRFRLPECAIIISPTTGFSIDNIGGNFKEIVWSIGNLATNSSSNKFIEFRLPCSNETQINCGQLTSITPFGTFNGINSCDSNQVNVQAQAITKTINECTSGCNVTGTGGSTASWTSAFPCPNSNTTPSASYVLTIPSDSNNSNLTIIGNIPDTTSLASISVTNNPCPSSTGIEYFTGTSWVTGTMNSIPQGATKFKIKFNCNIQTTTSSLSITINCGYIYNPNSTYPPPLNYFDCDLSFGANGISENNYTNINFTTSPQQNCLGLTLIEKVRLANSTSDFVQTISVDPRSELTYLLIFNSGSAINNLNLSRLINNQTTYLNNFMYAYGTASDDNNPNLAFTPLTLSTTPTPMNITQLSNPLITLQANTINISGINSPSGNNKLYIKFNVRLNNNIIGNTYVQSKFNVCQNLQCSLSNSSNVLVATINQISSSMQARCIRPTIGEWSNNLSVRNTEKIDFKIEIENTGSNPIKIYQIQNLKPMQGDSFVTNPSMPRNSQFQIDYVTSTPILVSTNSTNQTAFQNIITDYSLAGPDKQRDLCNSISGTPSNWYSTPTSINPNWVRFSYPNNNLPILGPGEVLTIVYRCKIKNATGSSSVAINSFSPKFTYQGSNVCQSLVDEQVIITNDGVGCEAPCINCASFGLLKQEKYLVSGWVKEEDDKQQNAQFKNYYNSIIRISFFNENGLIMPDFPISFYPSGNIIDGWQRIIGEFTVPGDSTTLVGDMLLELVNDPKDGRVTSYFDDIRILPSKGNMKSFVYDQKTQKLMAELDENNYSTFYEYDLEGGLIRIKKETEKGVFTIQETRSGNTKTGTN